MKDALGQHAIFQDIKVTPTGITGVNVNLLYGSLVGNETTQSDVIKAYVQSELRSQFPTFVELPVELIAPQYKHVHRPCVRLHRSLYGHPESGHWHNKFVQIVQKLGGKESSSFPSNFWFENRKLLLTLYVDDLVLSGPSSEHPKFWNEIRQFLNIEDPAPVDRVLGRRHVITRNGNKTKVQYDTSDFAQTCVDTYLELCPCQLKGVTTPFLDDATLPVDQWETRGTLQPAAARILMKCLWLARLCRADLVHPITVLARKITFWSVNDDRRLHRLMCYIDSTKDYRMTNVVKGDGSDLHILCFTDSDHAGKVEHGYSTSGGFVAVSGKGTYFPISWCAKKQTACRRSTTEAETISLAHTLFSEALPFQEHLTRILKRKVLLKCEQDNKATIQVVKNGYSSRLRHCSKTHKIDLTSLFDCFKEDDVILEYCPTEQQAADLFTKCLDAIKFQRALAMVGIGPPEK